MKKLGLTVEPVQNFVCPAGYSSLAQAAQQLTSAELAFAAEGVDRILTVSSDEQVAVLVFSEAANTQNYTPGYLLSAGAHAAAIRPSMPQAQWPQMHGVGYDPTLDVDAPPGPFTAVENRCIALDKANGIVAGSYTDDFYIFQGCGLLLLADAALRADGGVATGSTLINAIHGLGTSFASPGVIGDSTDFTGSRTDGPNAVRFFNYSASCTCMAYSGAQFPMP